MDLLKYLEPMKNLPERFSNLAFWRGVRKLRDEVVNAFEYVDSWGESIEADITNLKASNIPFNIHKYSMNLSNKYDTFIGTSVPTVDNVQTDGKNIVIVTIPEITVSYEPPTRDIPIISNVIGMFRFKDSSGAWTNVADTIAYICKYNGFVNGKPQFTITVTRSFGALIPFEYTEVEYSIIPCLTSNIAS